MSKRFKNLTTLKCHNLLIKSFIKRDLCCTRSEKIVFDYFRDKTFQQIFNDEKYGWASFYKNERLVYKTGM